MHGALRRIFAAFEAPGYRHIATSTFLFTGSWTMESIVQGWVVLQLTDSPFWVGAAAGIRGTSSLLFAIAGGTLADRFDRRRLLLATYLFIAAIAATLGVLAATGSIALWNVLPLVVLGGAIGLVGPNSSAMTYDLLGPARLLNASAFSFQSGAVARTFAGLAGGIALDRLGVAPSYFIVAALFLGSGAALLPLRVPHRATEAARENTLAALRAGLAYARRTRAVRELLTLSAITEVFGFACLFVLPVLARDVLGVSATGLGALTSASAAGQFVAMTALSLAGDVRRKGALLAGSTLAFGLAVVTLSLSSAFAVSLALMFLFGASASLYDTTMWTVMQITAAEQMRGRVMGLYMATFGLSQIGGFIVGAVATVASLPVALAVAGSIVTLNAARSLRSIVRVAPAADRVRLETPPEPMHGG